MGIIVDIRLASLDDVRDIVEVHCSDVDKWYKWVNGRKIEDRYENLSVKDKFLIPLKLLHPMLFGLKADGNILWRKIGLRKLRSIFLN